MRKMARATLHAMTHNMNMSILALDATRTLSPRTEPTRPNRRRAVIPERKDEDATHT